MTPGQCLAARRLLCWSQKRLGQAAGLNATSIGVFERSGILPRKEDGFPDWRAEIQAVLETAGIEFVDGDQLQKAVK